MHNYCSEEYDASKNALATYPFRSELHDIPQWDEVLPHICYDEKHRSNAIEDILSVLNMFPERVTKLGADRKQILSVSNHRAGVAAGNRRLIELIDTGRLFDLDMVIFGKPMPTLVFPTKSDVALHILRSFGLNREMVKAMQNPFASGKSKSLNVRKYCQKLFEELYLEESSNSNDPPAETFHSVAARFTIPHEPDNLRLLEILSHKTRIDAKHVLSFLPEALRECIKTSFVYHRRASSVEVRFESVLRDDRATSFEARVFFGAVKMSRYARMFEAEAKCHDALCQMMGRGRMEGKRLLRIHIWNARGRAYSMARHYSAEWFHSDRDLENRSTRAFIVRCEQVGYRDAIAFSVPSSAENRVVAMSPHLSNATVAMDAENWRRIGRFRGGVLANACNRGKTKFIADFALSACDPTLVICPKHLVSQWAEAFGGSASVVTSTSVGLPPRCAKILITSFGFASTVHFPSFVSERKIARVFVDEAHLVAPGSMLHHRLSEGVVCDCVFAVSCVATSNLPLMLRVIGYARFLCEYQGIESASCTSEELILRSVPVLQRRFLVTIGESPVRSQVVVQPTGEEIRVFAALREKLRGLNERGSSDRAMRKLYTIMLRMCGGGIVNVDVLLEIVGRHLSRKRPLDTPLLHVIEGMDPPLPLPYSSPTDKCAICLDDLDSPLQVPCHHVFCRVCVVAALRLGRPRCPVCRDRWELPVHAFTPDWKSLAVPKADDAKTPKKLEFKLDSVLDAFPLERGEIRMIGKMNAFERCAMNLKAAEHHGDVPRRLVVVCRQRSLARAYEDVLERSGFRVCRGKLFETKRRDFIQTEGFSTAVVLTFRNVAGLKLPGATDLWLMDQLSDFVRMHQAVHSCPDVPVVKSFLYPEGFDMFLNVCMRETKGKYSPSVTRNTLLECFLFRNDPTTTMGQAHALARKVFGPSTENMWVSAKQRSITFNRVFSVDVKTGMVTGLVGPVRSHRPLGMHFLLSPLDSEYVQWRRHAVPRVSGSGLAPPPMGIAVAPPGTGTGAPG